MMLEQIIANFGQHAVADQREANLLVVSADRAQAEDRMINAVEAPSTIVIGGNPFCSHSSFAQRARRALAR